jgi:GDP-L-fucose synthase
MYSGDLVDFIVRVVEEPTTCPDLVNVGLGWDLTINEYYAAIGEVLGYRGEFVHDLSKPTGMQQKLVDVSKSREMGWQSGTELRQGLQKTYDYYLEVSR